MKIKLLLGAAIAISSCLWTPLVGQTTFEKRIVSKPFQQSAGLDLGDVDQDGDLDILAGSGATGLFWYENQGGKPLRWVSHTVDVSIQRCLSVMVHDMDHDARMDLVAISWNDNSLICYRNLGNQVWEKKLISSQCGHAHELFVQDVDGDAWEDILVAAVTNNEIVWFQNPGTASTGWPRQQITNSFGGSRTVAAGDLDGDGKTDIVGGAFTGNRITIWKNLGGNPVQWHSYDLITGFAGAHRVEVTDLNGDGKNDIIGWAYTGNLLKWWENTGPDFSTWIVHSIDNQLISSCVGEAKDIDLDGDLDVVTTGYLSNQVVWYENTDSRATTWKKHNIDNTLGQPWMAFAGDLDGDQDIDVIAGGDSGNEIRWYENHPSGRMDSYLNYSDGKVNTGIFLPDNYNESATYELLLALPGVGDAKTFSSLRDYLIPVSKIRNSIILTADLPRAASPNYEFENPSQINEIINLAKSRFSVDPSKIYLMGAACQGKPILQQTLAATYPVKGAISVNPEIQLFNPDEWTGQAKPVAIAASHASLYYQNVETMAQHLWQDGAKIKLIGYDHPGSDYLTDELADLTIRCLNYIDSANFLNTTTERFTYTDNQPTINILGTGRDTRIEVMATQGDQIGVKLFDIYGRIACSLHQGLMTDQSLEIPLNGICGSIKPGLYVILAEDSKNRISTMKIILNSHLEQ